MSDFWRRLSPALRRVASELPQTRVARFIVRGTTPSNLRILAFHGVPDLERFAAVLDATASGYTPVSSGDVQRALAGGGSLPRHPVWFTFDDGLPSTFAAGEMLAARGIKATAFVCPGVLDTNHRLWFQVWQRCRDRDLLEDEEIITRFALARLKTLPDAERRAAVRVLQARLDGLSDEAPPQAEQAMLQSWVGQGHDVGNHTWDHPMLDRCSPAEQKDQVVRAHRALEERGFLPQFLAYPNGNFAPAAAAAASELGYSGSLLFDHRLTRLGSPPHQLSRLRIDSDAGRRRAASILSGAHSAAVHLVPGL